MDADGFLHLAGRLSRFSKIGGEMVPHGTVEEALLKVLDLAGATEPRLAVSSAADPAKGEQLIVLHVDDLAQACLVLLQHYDTHETINVGLGDDMPIRELAETVASVVGFEGTIEWDSSKPDGMPRKLLDTSRINELGWQPQITLRDGVASTYEWYLANKV